MSGNGGHSSALKAATSGSPPYDPGLRASQKSQGNARRNSPNQADLYNSQTGEEFSISEEETMSEEEEETVVVGSQTSSTAPFASGLRSLFPMGINQPRSSLREEPRSLVTPQTTSTRSRRGRSDLGVLQESDEVELIEPEDSNGGTPAGNDFRRASSLIQKEATKILQVLPAKEPPTLSALRSYNFIAELQFNKPINEKGQKMENSKEFSVPTCLGQWVKKTREVAPNLILHPYRQESGDNVITHEEQIPQDDGDAIGIYFHNHRVENNGILRGMIRFSITIPWMNLKDMRSPYFKWLTHNRIYLRHTSFDADSIVLLGYFHGEHPDAARLLDMTKELKERMKLPEDLDFQLAPRNLTVIDSTVAKTKFFFKAIAVETDGKMAGALREAFFRLGDPKVAKHQWPVTGRSLFVPMFRTTSWPLETLAAMAKSHSRIVSQLEQIFVENVFELDKKVTFKDTVGTETSRTLREAIQSSTNLEGESNVHSVHNTNRAGVIRILVTAANAKQAITFFGKLQEHLRAALGPEDLHAITQGNSIQITDRTYESSDSKVYAGYAAALLRENPQDGYIAPEISSPQRKKSRMEISYSSAAKRATSTRDGHNENDQSDQLEERNLGGGLDDTVDWEQKIQASFQKLFGDHPPIRVEDVEKTIQDTINRQAAESERRLDRRFSSFSSEIRQFTTRENEKSKRLIEMMFEKQNALFLTLTEQMQDTLLKLDENIKDIAYQTNTTIAHTETPRLDVRTTSPVAQRKDTGSAGLSDAVT